MNGATIKVYSKSKDGYKFISAHFQVKEFSCNDGTDTIFISPSLVAVLEKIRLHFGKPITINSGYRTESWNKKQGGATYSQHKYGMAADIKVSGISPSKVYAYADSLLSGTGGVGLYNTFTHVDVRTVKARWQG